MRRLEAQLRETERRCETLIASSRDPIAYLHEGMHVRANEAYFERLDVHRTHEGRVDYREDSASAPRAERSGKEQQ